MTKGDRADLIIDSASVSPADIRSKAAIRHSSVGKVQVESAKLREIRLSEST